MNLDQIKQWLGDKVTEMDNPHFFNFDLAVNQDFLTVKLKNEIISHLSNHTISLGDDFETQSDSYSSQGANIVWGVILSGFLDKLVDYWRNSNQIFSNDFSEISSYVDDFKRYLINQASSSETDVREICYFSGETLLSFPVFKEWVIRDLKELLEDKYVTQDDVNWIYLVVTNLSEDDQEEIELISKILSKENIFLKEKEVSNG